MLSYAVKGGGEQIPICNLIHQKPAYIVICGHDQDILT